MIARPVLILKKIARIALILAAMIAVINYSWGVYLRKQMSQTPYRVLPSPNGKWVLKIYTYNPAWRQSDGGVYRIYRANDQELQAEISVGEYTIFGCQTTWEGDTLLFCTNQEDGIDMPTSRWTKFLAQLP